MLYEILPDPRQLIDAAREGEERVLQIHRTIPDWVPVGHFEDNGTEVVDEVVSRGDYLGWLQQACTALGDALEVRFYDHFEEEFDASVLDDLDEIRNLSIDGLPIVRNTEAVGRLPRLTSLRFGPRRVSDARTLGTLGLQRLTHFTLAGTPTPTVDLSPLAEARSLRTLRLLGQGKNTEAIARLLSLSELAIQPSSRVPLDFISELVTLESLKLVVGNTASLSPIRSLPALQDLSVYEVHYLEDMGDLERFPSLRRLQVSDQPRITELWMGPRNAALEHLYLYSVPRLEVLKGFTWLPAVKSLFAYDSRLDLPFIDLPSTLTHFQLMTKAIRDREAHNDGVRARGLNPAVHPDATFSYK